MAEGLAGGCLFGSATAPAAAFGFAGFTVARRYGRRLEMPPAVGLASLFGALLSGPTALAHGQELVVPPHDMALCALYGAVLIDGSLLAYTLGSRHPPAAELALLSLGEVVLGPLWPWILLDEVPTPLTLVGGGIVPLALAGQAAQRNPASSSPGRPVWGPAARCSCRHDAGRLAADDRG